ncbi:MAG: alkyl hydroperoxide reductase [Planctomycetaceae bacterium]|nr:alkyl hydroperoxide reductase [Planctomycetaceae bacterium]
MFLQSRILLLFTAFLILGSVRRAKADNAPPDSEKRLAVPLLDLQGTIHELGQNDEGAVRVFVFLSTECPVSNSYLQPLNKLQQNIDTEKVHLFGVVTDATVKRAEAAKHFEEFKLTLPVLFDPAGHLAAELKPTHVPEAFVLNASGSLVYRGAIDDTWGSVGRRRSGPSNHYLADAIAAVLRGRPIATPKTNPVGCLFESFSGGGDDAAFTFNRDIAPIVYSRCLNCHRDGQVAPFALESYEQVAKRADWIVSVTEDRIMPPWIPHPGHNTFVGERWLTDRELSLLKRWAESGRARGDEADLPARPEFAEGWRLGKPDLVVKMPKPFTVYANGPDLFQNFVIPVNIPSDQMVAAIEFHPGNKRVVHHSVLFLDSNGVARKLDRATAEPGYSNFGGPGFAPTGALGGWSVGNTPRRLPNGMGRYLKKGSDLVMQIHYHPTGKEEVDQSEVGLYFIKKPVEETLKEPAKLVGSIWMANYEMDIPAGESNYSRTTTYTLPKDVIMVGVVPHMHLLGKSMKVIATLPANENEDAIEKTLIDIRNWNYNWQDEYYYDRPFKLPAGTRLTIDAVFDNSADNSMNPHSPPKRVTWGEETDDEMLYCFFLLSAEKTEDLIHVIFHNLQHDAEQPRARISRAEGE